MGTRAQGHNSLDPRLPFYAEREPGTHCLRMRQNSQKSWEFGYYRKISRILLRV